MDPIFWGYSPTDASACLASIQTLQEACCKQEQLKMRHHSALLAYFLITLFDLDQKHGDHKIGLAAK